MKKSIHDDNIVQEEWRRQWLDRLMRGWRVMRTEKHGRISGAVLVLLITLAAMFPKPVCQFFFPALAKTMLATYLFWLIVFSTLTVGGTLIILSRPFLHDRVSRSFIRAGVVNRARQPPSLIRRYPSTEFENCTVWELRVDGISPMAFQDFHSEIETAMNVNLVDVREGKDRKTVLLHTVPPTADLGSNIMWNDSEASAKDNIIMLGQGYMGKVSVNIDVSPHFIISGTTGSGKSVLMKCVLRQAVLHKNNVVLADFKGGIDYVDWQEHTNVITDEEEFLAILEEALAEIGNRKAMFLKVGAKNITEYRAKSGEPIKRMYIAVDELAELLDTSGASKERKALLSKIENALSSVARLGRAFGFHLVLGLQRPDTSVLPPQIKACCDNRICGRADAILSTIVLGDGRAHEKISKHSRGRFLNQDDVMFQAYNYTD